MEDVSFAVLEMAERLIPIRGWGGSNIRSGSLSGASYLLWKHRRAEVSQRKLEAAVAIFIHLDLDGNQVVRPWVVWDSLGRHGVGNSTGTKRGL